MFLLKDNVIDTFDDMEGIVVSIDGVLNGKAWEFPIIVKFNNGHVYSYPLNGLHPDGYQIFKVC